MTKICCKNYNCPENNKLEDPILITFGRFYTSIGKEDNLCFGECKSKILNLVSAGLSNMKVKYSVALCIPTKERNAKMEKIRLDIFICSRKDCANNNGKKCLKDKIIVDKLIIEDEEYWVCKNFSQTKISGHRDWSRNLSGGVAKGGHIDDEYANRLDHDNKVNKSYGNHMRQKYERD